MNACRNSHFFVEARTLVSDLYRPNALMYWLDFLSSMTIGYVFATAYMRSRLFSLEQVVCFFVAGFALYRLVSFIHAIVHFRANEMKWF